MINAIQASIAQPDIRLTLDPAGVIREATLCDAMAGEPVEEWLGQAWGDTVGSGAAQVRRLIEAAWTTGVSGFGRMTQHFPSGRELPIEYAAIRLGETAGLVAVGKSLVAVAGLRSRLVAAQQAREQEVWKLRETESRYRLLFEAANEAIVLLGADRRRVLEANPAATSALGLAAGDIFEPVERESFQAALAQAEAQGRAPGIVVRLGAAGTAWLLRCSMTQFERGAIFLLQFAAQEASAGQVPPRMMPVGELGRTPLPKVVRDATDAIERDFILAALERAGGNRSAAAELLGLSRQALYLKLSRYGPEDGLPPAFGRSA